MYFTDAEWYEIDIMEFGQTQVDEWYGSDVSFDDGGYIVWDDSELNSWEELDQQMDVYDEFIETYEYTEEVYLVSYDDFEHDPLPFDTSEELIEDFIFRETVLIADYEDVDTYIEFESIEELDEWYEEELAQLEEEEEELLAEEEIIEAVVEEIEEERIAEEEEEEEERKGGITAAQLNVVAQTITTATNSVSNPASNAVTTRGWGSSSSGGGSSSVGTTSGNTTTTAVASSASGGGFSTSNSPSISDQIQTAQVQTNTVLSLSQDMSSTSGSTQTVSNVSVIVTPLPGLDATPQVVMADVQVTDMQGKIDTAIGGVMTASEADQIADQIVADNIKEQQEAGQTTQEETGQYADQSTLVAFMGYVPGFDAYREATIPQAATWYEPRVIYADASISDNIDAFYGLARKSLNTMQSLINSQPNL